ncbi:MAG: hypothetical protein AAF849_17935 [Bacteroidota bacterium]
MKLANPIYDTVFKYLMEDTEIARRFIGKIIDEEIVSLDLRPQENTVHTKKYDITILRFDFKAIIKLKKEERQDWDSEYKTVLIELQKAKKSKDIFRFRRYLGNNYLQRDEVVKADGTVEIVELPILTIYILGFPMPPIKTSAIKVNRVYTDLITNEVLDVQTEFIEKLTHDCYVILIKKLPPDSRTELERILQVFNQVYIVDDRKFLEIDKDITEGNELLEMMLNRLKEAATDANLIESIYIEEEVEEEIDEHIREKEDLREQNEDLREQNEGLQEQNEGLQEQNEGLQEQNEDLQDKVKEQLEEREELKRRIEELERKLKGKEE